MAFKIVISGLNHTDMVKGVMGEPVVNGFQNCNFRTESHRHTVACSASICCEWLSKL